MIRPPAVAGRFYPADPEQLASAIDQFSVQPSHGTVSKTKARACVVPHAGYMFSGHVAGAVYGALELPRKCILIGPRHFPRGEPLAILTEGAFESPLGDLPIDAALARQILEAYPKLREDAVAHAAEHSLEVQIPFLQRLGKKISFVPIALASDRYGVLEELGGAIADVIVRVEEPVLIIASSDMNHYESDTITRQKDGLAIDQILKVDPRGLHETLRANQISMCGYAATVATLVAARNLGVTQSRLIRYATSAEMNSDYDQVVGYAGIVLA